jgi:hypothetical protein
LRGKAVKKAVEPFELLDALEMMATVPDKLPCLVEDLLLDVSVSQLSAKPKTGKSSLARQLAVAVAEGNPFLGHVTNRGNVLYINTEGPGWVVAAHFKKLGYTGRHGKIKVVSQRMPSANAEGLAKLELALTAFPCSLVVIDTAAKFMRAFDSNNYDLMGLAMEDLEDRAKKFKTHIMLLFHNKKRVEADHGDNTMGSAAFRAGTDTNLYLTKQGSTRILSAEYRADLTPLEPTLLTFNEATGEMSLGNTVESVETAHTESRTRKTRDRIASALLAAIAEGKTVTREKLLAAVTGKAVTVLEVLVELCENGMVQRTGDGTKGDPLVYSLRAETVKPPHTVQTSQVIDLSAVPRKRGPISVAVTP